MAIEQMAQWGSIPIYRHQLLDLKISYGVRIAVLPTISSTAYMQWVGKDLERLDMKLRLFNREDWLLWLSEQTLSSPKRVFSFGLFGGNDWVMESLTYDQTHVNYMTGTNAIFSLQYTTDLNITAIRESV